MAIANFEFEGGGLRNRDIAAGAAIAAEKVVQQYTVSRSLFAAEGTTVTALEMPWHIVPAGTTELARFEACVFTAITGNYTVTVDLHKSTGAGAFATVMSSTIVFDNSIPARTPLQGVINDESGILGDQYKVKVTVTGSSGSQAAGLLVSLTVQDRLA